MNSVAATAVAKSLPRRLAANAIGHRATSGGFLRRLHQTGRSAPSGSRSSRIRNPRSGGGRKRSKPCSSSRPSSSPKQQQGQRRQKATLAGNLSLRAGRQGGTQNHHGNHNNNLRKSIDAWLNEPRTIPIPRWISPRMVTFRLSECYGHASFFLVAVSYAVDDFLHLRLIAIAGSSANLVFTYFHPHGRVLWLPFKWNCVFVALNSWRVAKVVFDHYLSTLLPPPVARVYENHFPDAMEKTDFARLVRLGTIENYEAGETVFRQGEENRYVRLVVSGDLEVDRDGQTTYWLHEGQFISEMGLHAGLGLRGTVTSCCSVSAASGGVKLVRWDRTELMHLLELHASIDRALKAVMSWDIVSKLKSQRVLLASGKIDDPERWTRKRREQSLARYGAILQNMLAHPQYLNERKHRLTHYREIHQVGEADHVSSLERNGWTLQEFEAGYKEGQLDEDELEVQKLGFRWWCRSWWRAL
mmetsp:Transcript_7071/g.14439  ORF Transcript_7071/g.14439 Transcript_7071/m.14439 type:complete len:472 (-) Transcript_7071:393-1808(-)